MSDLGLTHVAFAVADLEASVDFYSHYAGMQEIHRRDREDIPGARVAWLTDYTRPFVLVLAEHGGARDTPLGPFGHLGVACASRAEVERLANQARTEGRLRKGPQDLGPPAGYLAYIADPDDNILEVSYGQDIAFTIEGARANKMTERADGQRTSA